MEAVVVEQGRSGRSLSLWLGAGVMALLIFVAFGWGLRAPFFYDDQASIWANPNLRAPWQGVGDLFPVEDSPVSGRPISAISLKVDYELFGLTPWAYRMENMLWHLACGLLLWRLLVWAIARAVPLSSEEKMAGNVPVPGWDARVRLWGPWCVALLWLVHPLNLDAVVYITQRTELLCSFFYLLTLVAACVWAGRWAAWVAIAACFLGMATKEVMVSAPIAVLLLDRAFLSGSFLRALRSRPALYVGLAASWSVLAGLILFRRTEQSIGFDLGVSSWEYLLTQSGVLLWYLSRVFYPVGLSIHHGVEVVRDWREAWLTGSAVLGLLGVSFWLLWKHPRVGTPAVLFWFLLAPSSSVVPIVTEIAAERRMYLAGACVIILTWCVLHQLAGRYPLSESARRYGPSLLVGCGLVVSLLVNQVRLSAFGDSVAIWEEVYVLYPDDFVTLTNLGVELEAEKQSERAEALFLRALEREPNGIMATVNLAGLYLRQGDMERAQKYVERGIQMRPLVEHALLAKGVYEGQLGHLEDARRWLEKTIEKNPYFGQAYVNLAVAYQLEGDSEQARALIRRALEIEPDNKDALEIGAALKVVPR